MARIQIKKFIYSHLKLPLYEKRDIEEIIFNYGIQNAIQHYILNKKIRRYNGIY